MASLQLTSEKNGPSLAVVMSGQMDEDAPYHTLDLKAVETITFNCENVSLINSTGLQKWVRFLEALPAKMGLTFTRCSVRMVSQINMFSGFFAQRTVSITSFYAPYYCATCDKSHIHLLDVAKDKAVLQHEKAPVHQCPQCQAAMEFDGLEKKYFLFIRTLGLIR